MKLMNSEIRDLISRPVFEDKAEMDLDKVDRVPTTADVHLFYIYIDTQRKLFFSELSKGFSLPVWRKLIELTMASIIVFNKRRVGDIQNMMVKHFEQRTSLAEAKKDLYQRLSDNDKKIADRFKHVVIRGKKRRQVPLLLKPEMEHCLDLPSETRWHTRGKQMFVRIRLRNRERDKSC